MNAQQSVFELWNYTFLFMTVSTLAAFIVDMIGHKTKTISSIVFSLAILAGMTTGEVISISPISDLNLKLAIAILLSISISVLIPWKFRTTDPEIHKKTTRANNISTS